MKRLAIYGLGLMGASLGLALRQRLPGVQVTGIGRDAARLAAAREAGAAHTVTTDPVAGVREAQLLVLALPVERMADALRACAPGLSAGCIVTDVGSVKRPVVETLRPLLPAGCTFVGSHPMTGSERRGHEAADPLLYENALTVVTPVGDEPVEAVAAVESLWHTAGSRTLRLNPAAHDTAVAAVSHLPHLLASVLVLSAAENGEQALGLAAGGFRDVTRIASGDPALWRGIFAANRAELLGQVDRFRGVLDRLRAQLADGDDTAIEQALVRAREIRDGLPKSARGLVGATYDALMTVPDKPGVLARITALLAGKGLNIIDIEVLKVREGCEGSIRLSFLRQDERDRAITELRAGGITVRPW